MPKTNIEALYKHVWSIERISVIVMQYKNHIPRIAAVSMAVIIVSLGMLSLRQGMSDKPAAIIMNNNIWLQFENGSYFQLTGDNYQKCPGRNRPKLSPDKQHVLYYYLIDNNPIPYIGIINMNTGYIFSKKLGHRYPISKYAWIDNERVGITREILYGHVYMYQVFNVVTGDITWEYAGGLFSWSPDKNSIAYREYVDPQIYYHHADSDTLMINDDMVYPPQTREKVKHRFRSNIAWNTDGSKITLIDEFTTYSVQFRDDGKQSVIGFKRLHLVIINVKTHETEIMKLDKQLHQSPNSNYRIKWDESVILVKHENTIARFAL